MLVFDLEVALLVLKNATLCAVGQHTCTIAAASHIITNPEQPDIVLGNSWVRGAARIGCHFMDFLVC